MKHYVELFLQAVFGALIIGCVAALVFALVSELVGWYEPDGKYHGPFSKSRRK